MKPQPKDIKSFALRAVLDRSFPKAYGRVGQLLDFLSPGPNLNRVARQVAQVVDEINKLLKLVGYALSQALIYTWSRLITEV